MKFPEWAGEQKTHDGREDCDDETIPKFVRHIFRVSKFAHFRKLRLNRMYNGSCLQNSVATLVVKQLRCENTS
jgi:hypothetical protein